MKYAKRYERKNTFVFFALSFLIASTIFAAITSVHEVTTAASSETDVWDGSSSSTNWTGQGTAVDPYIIDSCAKFKGFANNTISGTTYSDYTFKITKNLNFSGSAIGFNNFQGVLDGNGNTISNASFNGSGSTYSFCETATDAVIKNIIFDSCSTLDNYGFIINTATNCTLINCTVNANCSGGRAFIYSLSGGSVLSCVNYATFNITTCAGGMVSHASGNVTIKDCKNYGSIANNSDVNNSCGAGGIVGRYAGNGTLSITRCINFGTVSGASNSTCRIGGILGQMRESSGTVIIDKCINKGTIGGSADNAGGILGVSAGDSGTFYMYNCINLADVTATKKWGGGLIGYVGTYCYVYGCAHGAGNLGSASNYNGAFAGHTTYQGSYFQNCYNNHASYYCVGESAKAGNATSVWTAGSANTFKQSGTEYTRTRCYYGQSSTIQSGASFATTLNGDRGRYEICDWGICDDPEINYAYAMPGYCTKDTVYADWTNGVDQGVQSSSKGPYGTDSQPVKSVQDAKWLCKKTTASTILAKSVFTVTTHDYWGFNDKPNVTLKRNSSNTSWMVWVDSDSLASTPYAGKLRIEKLTLDGGAVWTGTVDSVLGRGTTNSGLSGGTVAMICCNYRTQLSLNNCTLQNNSNGAISGTIVNVDINNCNIINNQGSAVRTGTDCVVTINGSKISGNSDSSGGGMYFSSGSVKINNCEISGNKASVKGGGIYVQYQSNVELSGNSKVSGNSSPNGAGVCVFQNSNYALTTFTLNGGEISGNISSSNGGGVYLEKDTSTTFDGPSFIMNGGDIKNNTSSNYGGGVCSVSGESTFTLNSGTISNNSSEEDGAGVYFYGTFNMNGGTISSNNSNGIDGGGGVYIYGGTFNMTEGTISSNVSYSFGGGIYFYSGTFNMSGGTISGNKASYGGGVYFSSSDAFNLSGNVDISGNTDKNGTTAGNVYLADGKVITLVGNLSGSGKIGINTVSTPTASTQVNVVQAGGTNLTTISDANKAYFTSDNTSYRIVRTPADPSKLKLAVYPTWTVTIPAVTSSSTTSTVNLAASLTGFVEGLDNVDVKLEVPTGGLFSLTHPNDSSSVIKYQVKKGGTALSAGTQTVATFNTGQTTQDLTYAITDMSGAKYAGTHKSTMTFKVAYRES